ncbi:MAG: PIG-L family deacetylase [Acidobacteriaceae bacterium]
MTHRLLVVTAHPDDESGGFGGALLLAHRAGAETNLLCFTDGQAAHFRGVASDDEELGRMRRAELDSACDVLGLTRCDVLHYPDGALPEQNFLELVGVVVERIRRWRPQVVLTFGADGSVNLHRDHTMVSLVTTAAFHWAARGEMFAETGAAWAAQKLYYASTPFVSVRNHPELTAVAATVPWSLELHLGALADEKMAAFGKHTSQQAVLERVGRENVRKGMEAERYLLAAKRGMGPAAEDDMWAGIVE